MHVGQPAIKGITADAARRWPKRPAHRLLFSLSFPSSCLRRSLLRGCRLHTRIDSRLLETVPFGTGFGPKRDGLWSQTGRGLVPNGTGLGTEKDGVGTGFTSTNFDLGVFTTSSESSAYVLPASAPTT